MEMDYAMLSDGKAWIDGWRWITQCSVTGKRGLMDGEHGRGVVLYKHNGRNARNSAVEPICFGITYDEMEKALHFSTDPS